MRIPVLALSDPLLLEHQPGRVGIPSHRFACARTLEYLDQHRLTGVEIRRPRPATNEECAASMAPELVEALNALAGDGGDRRRHLRLAPDPRRCLPRRRRGGGRGGGGDARGGRGPRSLWCVRPGTTPSPTG